MYTVYIYIYMFLFILMNINVYTLISIYIYIYLFTYVFSTGSTYQHEIHHKKVVKFAGIQNYRSQGFQKSPWKPHETVHGLEDDN